MAPTNAVATGVWTAQSKNNAKFGRQLIQMLFENNDATPMNGTRSGVVPTTGLTIMSDLLVYNVVGLTMNVAPGWGLAHRSGQGPYPGALDAVASIACDTAPASNPRNDLVMMRMYDATLDTPPGGNPCRIEVITGTPAASPLDPMTVNALGVYTGFADGAGGVGIPLARAQVSTSGVITLSDMRKTASLIGAVRLLLPGDSDTSGRVGQPRYNPTTDLLEIKDSSGTWRTIRKGPDVGGEWKDARTTPTLAGAGPTKLQFATNVVTPNGLTFNGTDTWTAQTAGPYSFFCQIRATSAVNGGIAVGATTYADATHILPFIGFTGGPDYAISGTAYLTAGQQFCFWFYNNGSATTINNALRNGMAKIWKQQAAA